MSDGAPAAPPVALLEKMLSASAGALLTSLVVTPLDVIKVRMQAESSPSTASPGIKSSSTPTRWSPHWGPNAYIFCHRFRGHQKHSCGCRTLYIFEGTPRPTAAAAAGVAVAPPIRGTLDGILKIGRMEGLRGLWRGLSPTLLMSVPATVVYFLGYEAIREGLKGSAQLQGFLGPGRLEWAAPLMAGSAARIVAVSLISPLELLRTRMQHRGPQGGILAVARDIGRDVQRHGVRVLYRGLVPTLWRDVPFSALYWMGFERFRVIYRRLLATGGDAAHHPGGDNNSNNFLSSFLAGASSGMIAAAITTPFDVAKTRQQVHTLGQSPRHHKGIARHLAEIWRGEGLAGLVRGIVPRICRVAPSCAIMVGSYELGKAYLHARHGGGDARS